MYIGKTFPQLPGTKTINHYGDIEDFTLRFNHKKFILWYPKDFTFICPTELFAVQELIHEFEKRNTLVFAASCDTLEVHYAWLNVDKENGGISGIHFPLISDVTRTLSKELGILNEENVTYRASYLMDESNVVFYESINDMNIGRNIHEILRILDAKIYTENNKTVCPSNWERGDEGLDPTREGISTYLKNNY